MDARARYCIADPWLADTAPWGKESGVTDSGGVFAGRESGRGFAMAVPYGAKDSLVSGSTGIVRDAGIGMVWTIMVAVSGADGRTDMAKGGQGSISQECWCAVV